MQLRIPGRGLSYCILKVCNTLSVHSARVQTFQTVVTVTHHNFKQKRKHSASPSELSDKKKTPQNLF